eukprot:CAMPEP_0173249106 /NCGR_PEP_ID=MMETSP1142-20121109/18830_1 /TAXON_ID=483371 /ORGANISM="non described non described, Strain CCMP2298" /LENGTH=169 /DNA_ID=CAMNT_0014181687 /DNA_START=289 /DNA_END=798 /DNA_ORIENTATION=-
MSLFQGVQVVTSNSTSLTFNTHLLQQSRQTSLPYMPEGYNQAPNSFAMNRATVVPTNTPQMPSGYAPQMPPSGYAPPSGYPQMQITPGHAPPMPMTNYAPQMPGAGYSPVPVPVIGYAQVPIPAMAPVYVIQAAPVPVQATLVPMIIPHTHTSASKVVPTSSTSRYDEY